MGRVLAPNRLAAREGRGLRQLLGAHDARQRRRRGIAEHRRMPLVELAGHTSSPVTG
jgi:hypothetical protein